MIMKVVIIINISLVQYSLGQQIYQYLIYKQIVWIDDRRALHGGRSHIVYIADIAVQFQP